MQRTEAKIPRTVVELYGLTGQVVHRAQVVADALPEALVWRDRVFARIVLRPGPAYRELEAAQVAP